MKKELVVSLILGLLAIFGIIVLLKPKLMSNQGITAEDVKQHSSESNCWVIVKDKVYNVTSLLGTHPAGKDKILPLCGADATTTFTTRSGKGEHPDSAQEKLQTYFVGNLAK